MKVRGVATKDTNRDLSDLLNVAADAHGFDPVGFVGGAIAESGLKEHAARERQWPDVSYGLWQPTVKWIGPEVTHLDRAPDGTALDTPWNRGRVKGLCWDAIWLVAYVAPRYAALLKRWTDPLEAWCRWNKPNIEGSANPNRANYERSLNEAEQYREAPQAMAFNIGPGVLQAMADAGDEPRSDELYQSSAPNPTVSLTYGRDALYVYYGEDNAVSRLPLEPVA